MPENVILSPTGMPGIPAVHLVVGCGGPAGAKCLGSDTAPGTDPVRLDVHPSQITLRDSTLPPISLLDAPDGWNTPR